jgi:hypothetical protein
MKTDEDEAFEQIEAKQKINEVVFTQGLDPYRELVRNQTIDEIARAIEKFKPAFGPDTVSSFAIFVRGMKR